MNVFNSSLWGGDQHAKQRDAASRCY